MALIDYSNKIIYWDEVNWTWLPYITYRHTKTGVKLILQYKDTVEELKSDKDFLTFLGKVGYSLQPISKLGITELSLGCYLYEGVIYSEDGRKPLKTLSRLLSLISGKTPTNMSAQLKGLGILTEEKVKDLVSEQNTIEFRGRHYSSYSNLARKYGVHHNTLFKKVKDGVSLEEIISEHENSKIVDHLGKEYKTEKEMFKAWGITRNAYAGRKDLGWSLEEILTTPLKSRRSKDSWVDFNGKVFPSLTAMCKEYGVSRESVTLYMNKGMSPGDAIKGLLSRRNNKSKVVDHLGNEFSSYSKMLEYWGVFGATFRYRMKSGWSLEEALTGKKSNK
jgi:hypothetical protein